MMRSKSFLPLLLIILPALLVACISNADLPSPAPVSATPTPPLATATIAPASINITRGDYEAALAKWQSQGIEEYEVEISEIPHASDTASSLIYYVRGSFRADLPKPWPTSGPIATPEYAAFSDYPDPIASSFTRIDQALGVIESKGQVPYQFKVEFDPTLGYPSYYQEYCLEDYPYKLCPTDSFTSEKVVRLEVLKRRQP